MQKTLKILMLEDSQEDIYLIKRELERGGILFTSSVVNTKDDFQHSLHDVRPDVILADHSLPKFNSIEALKMYQQFRSETKIMIPFILITGSVSEEFAAQCIKAGADDYILKDRLKRLPSSILSALEKARLESDRLRFLDELIANEAMMREAEQLAHVGSWQVDLVTKKYKWSDESYRIFGYEPGVLEVSYEAFLDHVHPDDRQLVKDALDDARLRDAHPCEFRIIDRVGKLKYILSNIVVKRNEHQQPVQLLGFNHDVTHERNQTLDLERQNRQLKEIAWIQSHEVRGPLARLMGLINIVESDADDEKYLKELLKSILESAHELDAIVRKIVRKTEALKGNEHGNES